MICFYYISMLSTTGGKLKVTPREILKNYNKNKKNHQKQKQKSGNWLWNHK